MATFINGESLSSVRTKINDAIDKVDGNAAFSNDISVTGNITVTGTVDGRDVATDGTKLDGIEASADVTDTANVTAAGALMDSELASEASVKALDQGVATTDSPTFAGLTTTANVSFGDNDKAIFGAGSDLQIYHNGSHSYIDEVGTGSLLIRAEDLVFQNSDGSENYGRALANGAFELNYNAVRKLATTTTGIDVTGSVTADGLTVDGSYSQSKASGTFFTLTDTTNSKTGYINWDSGNWDIFTHGPYKRLTIADSGDISFYEDTGTTAKLTWSAADEELQLASGVALELNGWTITESGGSLYFATGGTNKMKLDASGNLQVVGNVEANATIS